MIWTHQVPPTTDIFRAATLLWGVAKSDILSENRESRLVRQRWIVFYIMESRGLTHQQIGDLFGRHSSTITYGLQQHLGQTDEEYIENSDALVDLHNQLIHGHDPHPRTSDGCYRVYPNGILGRRECPNMGGFSDYDKLNHKFK